MRAWRPCARHLGEAVVEILDALAEQAAVGLELGFTGSAQADTAFLPLEVSPAAHQPRRQVLELRQLHLQLALEGLRTLREDIQYQSGTIEHPALQFAFEIALLRRRQRVVE